MQLLRPAGALAEELQGVVAPWPRPGRYKELRCEGSWEKWRIKDVKEGWWIHGMDITVYLYLSLYIYNMYMYMYLYVSICIHIYIIIYLCICICICTCIYHPKSGELDKW